MHTVVVTGAELFVVVEVEYVEAEYHVRFEGLLKV